MRKWMLLMGLLAAVFVVPAALAAEKAAEPSWVEPMKKVHEGFKGDVAYVAQLGDSITYSMAFWSPMDWADPDEYIPDDGLPKRPEGKRWRDVIKGARDKGGENGNYSGWRVDNILKVIDDVLAKKKPEAAIIMVGTNDVRGNKVPEGYKDGVEKVIEKCLAAKCIPILNTIPPMKGCAEGVAGANKVIKELAEKHKVPLVDYHAAIIERQPDDKWMGTLISGDGVHPSGGKTNDYSEANLKASGYALRNWVNFMMVRQVYFKVIAAK